MKKLYASDELKTSAFFMQRVCKVVPQVKITNSKPTAKISSVLNFFDAFFMLIIIYKALFLTQFGVNKHL